MIALMIGPEHKNIPEERWIPESLWRKIISSVPLGCIDVVFQRADRSILYGFRIILPYKNVWALPGGRILYRENLVGAARRIGNEYGLGFDELCLIGVFPVVMGIRSDLTIAVAALGVTGEPHADGKEFSRLTWEITMPHNLGRNYQRILSKWARARESEDFTKLNRLL